LETCPPEYSIGFPVRSEYFTFGSLFSLLLLSFLRSKLVDVVSSSSEFSTRFCTGRNDDGFRPFIPAFLPFAASTVTSTICRFLRENEENKRTFVRLGSVAKEILVKDEENIACYSLLCFCVL
jgi:hypothetical protein